MDAGVRRSAAVRNGSSPLRESLAAWAEAYGNQTEIDYAKLAGEFKDGTFAASASVVHCRRILYQ